MPLNIAQQQLLRAALDKTTEKFFRSRQRLVLTDAPVAMDATGLLVVLSGWVGDLIAGAPEDMKDQLFLSFADNVVTVAGIKAQDPEQPQETLQ